MKDAGAWLCEGSTLFGFEGAAGKWGASALEDAPLAQLVEQLTLNQWVPGSNP